MRVHQLRLRLWRPGELLAAWAAVAAPLAVFAGEEQRPPGPSPPGQSAPDDQTQPPMDSDQPPPNIPLPTLGGRQFWGDVVHFRGWRIQQNVFTGHYRLLDPRDVRRAWGTRSQCTAELERIKHQLRLPPLSGQAVILAHGIIRSSKSFTQMKSRLEEAGYLVVPFDYPSTRVTIPQAAGYLQQVIDSLSGVSDIHFVVHSMGGLVVRAYLGRTAEHPDPRLRRMVMIGVPNRGARLANILRDQPLYKTVFGPSGQQLVEDPAGVIAQLPTPPLEFAVVAGSRGDPAGYNPLLPGDDDAVVSVEATRLPGAADFLAVHGIHSFLPSHPVVIEAALRFLSTGSLHPDGHTEPIPAAKDAPAGEGG